VIILLFGPPGCGKGTQAEFLARYCRIPAISTGDIFRAEFRAGTSLGKQAYAIINSGGLVSNEIVNRIVEQRLEQPDCTGGFLLDGYPRTLGQAIFLDRWIERHCVPAPLAIQITVPANVLVERITFRLTCPVCRRVYNLRSQPPRTDGLCDADGVALIRRADDTKPVLLARLQEYEQAIGQVLEHYRAGLYYCVDGTRPPQSVSREIARLIDSPRQDRRQEAIVYPTA
jgi:adenylate kinase